LSLFRCENPKDTAFTVRYYNYHEQFNRIANYQDIRYQPRYS
jgi:hypothetical protein